MAQVHKLLVLVFLSSIFCLFIKEIKQTIILLRSVVIVQVYNYFIYSVLKVQVMFGLKKKYK